MDVSMVILSHMKELHHLMRVVAFCRLVEEFFEGILGLLDLLVMDILLCTQLSLPGIFEDSLGLLGLGAIDMLIVFVSCAIFAGLSVNPQ
jgi:hypothetical protein